MAMVVGSQRRHRSHRIGVYALLITLGVVMLFPFVFVVGSSLKSRTDIFTYPPRVIPREQQAVNVGGADVPAYLVDGVERGLVDEVRLGTYAPVDDLDATVDVLASEVQDSEGPDGQRTTVIDGEEEELYLVPVNGDIVEMVQISRTTQGIFALPADPSDTVLATVRTAEPVRRIDPRPENFTEVLEVQTLDRSLTNTALVTILVVVGTVVTSILGGYAFARIDFPGRDAMFLLYLGSIMVPFVILIIPLYQLMVALGWVDSLAALVFPFFFNAYGTFLIRQFFVTVPYELEEAAIVDGASRWTILWRIYVPLAYPAIATLSTFMFLHAWNSFVWPFVVINAGNTENHVLTLSLQVLGGRAADTPNLIYAGVVIAIAVPVTVFVLAQRYFVENVATSGLK